MEGQGFDFETILGVLYKISPFAPLWVLSYDLNSLFSKKTFIMSLLNFLK